MDHVLFTFGWFVGLGKRAHTCMSSVKWGLLARNKVGLFHIFEYVKTIKKPLKLPFYKKHHFLR